MPRWGLVRAVAADRAGILMFDPDDPLRFKAGSVYRKSIGAEWKGMRPGSGAFAAQAILIADITQEHAWITAGV